MQGRLQVDEFVIISPLTGENKDEVTWSGREMVVMFGFDPDKCILVVDARNVLHVRQEGVNGGRPRSTEHWRHACFIR